MAELLLPWILAPLLLLFIDIGNKIEAAKRPDVDAIAAGHHQLGLGNACCYQGQRGYRRRNQTSFVSTAPDGLVPVPDNWALVLKHQELSVNFNTHLYNWETYGDAGFLRLPDGTPVLRLTAPVKYQDSVAWNVNSLTTLRNFRIEVNVTMVNGSKCDSNGFGIFIANANYTKRNWTDTIDPQSRQYTIDGVLFQSFQGLALFTTPATSSVSLIYSPNNPTTVDINHNNYTGQAAPTQALASCDRFHLRQAPGVVIVVMEFIDEQLTVYTTREYPNGSYEQPPERCFFDIPLPGLLTMLKSDDYVLGIGSNTFGCYDAMDVHGFTVYELVTTVTPPPPPTVPDFVFVAKESSEHRRSHRKHHERSEQRSNYRDRDRDRDRDRIDIAIDRSWSAENLPLRHGGRTKRPSPGDMEANGEEARARGSETSSEKARRRRIEEDMSRERRRPPDDVRNYPGGYMPAEKLSIHNPKPVDVGGFRSYNRQAPSDIQQLRQLQAAGRHHVMSQEGGEVFRRRFDGPGSSFHGTDETGPQPNSRLGVDDGGGSYGIESKWGPALVTPVSNLASKGEYIPAGMQIPNRLGGGFGGLDATALGQLIQESFIPSPNQRMHGLRGGGVGGGGGGGGTFSQMSPQYQSGIYGNDGISDGYYAAGPMISLNGGSRALTKEDSRMLHRLRAGGVDVGDNGEENHRAAPELIQFAGPLGVIDPVDRNRHFHRNGEEDSQQEQQEQQDSSEAPFEDFESYNRQSYGGGEEESQGGGGRGRAMGDQQSSLTFEGGPMDFGGGNGRVSQVAPENFYFSAASASHRQIPRPPMGNSAAFQQRFQHRQQLSPPLLPSYSAAAPSSSSKLGAMSSTNLCKYPYYIC